MSKMTKRQKIDASREARLWISSILVPIGSAVTAIAVSRPDLVEKAKSTATNVKDKAVKKYNEVKEKFKK